MLNKKIIAKNFSDAANNYNSQAQTQTIAAKKLVELVNPFIAKNSKILDIGSGTSFIEKNLTKNFSSNIEIHEIDLAPQMLNHWQERPKNVIAICDDFENFQFKNNSFDIVASSFSLQWIENIDNCFKKIYEILTKNGVLIFCLPIFGSLEELIKSSIDSDCNFNFLSFFKETEIKNSLLKNQFSLNFSQVLEIEESCENAILALKKIKKTGASYSNHSQKAINKNKLINFNDFYLRNFLKEGKKLIVSLKSRQAEYEIELPMTAKQITELLKQVSKDDTI